MDNQSKFNILKELIDETIEQAVNDYRMDMPYRVIINDDYLIKRPRPQQMKFDPIESILSDAEKAIDDAWERFVP